MGENRFQHQNVLNGSLSLVSQWSPPTPLQRKWFQIGEKNPSVMFFLSHLKYTHQLSTTKMFHQHDLTCTGTISSTNESKTIFSPVSVSSCSTLIRFASPGFHLATILYCHNSVLLNFIIIKHVLWQNDNPCQGRPYQSNGSKNAKFMAMNYMREQHINWG